jgi:hypothetical protein
MAEYSCMYLWPIGHPRGSERPWLDVIEAKFAEDPRHIRIVTQAEQHMLAAGSRPVAVWRLGCETIGLCLELSLSRLRI